MEIQKTFIMVKPDGVERRLVGEVISRIERKGFKILRAQMMEPSKELVEEHYEEHKDKPFFSELVDYIAGNRVMGLEIEGDAAIEVMRLMIGHRDPREAAPGTIRGDFAHNLTENIVHGSDSPEAAERELKLWFE